MEGVKAALQSGADVNTKNEHSQTGLLLAVLNKHNSVVELLLSRPNIDVNWKGIGGGCALHAAILFTNIEPLKMLLNVPTIDVNAVNNLYAGFSTVQWAVLQKNYEALKLLLDVPGIDVNIVNNYGGSAVHVALGKTKSLEVLKLLLDVPNIDVNIVNNVGESVVHEAVNENNIEGLKLLLSHPNLTALTLNQKEKWYGATPVMLAVIKKSSEQLALLVDDPRVDLDTTDEEGWSLEEVATARWPFLFQFSCSNVITVINTYK